MHGGIKMTSRELVLHTLEFTNTSGRVPRQLWSLPWAWEHYPGELAALERDFPWDIAGPETVFTEPFVRVEGDPCTPGRYVDEWGCVFTNLQRGIIGEVKHPLVVEDDWGDAGKVHIPEEMLSFDVERVNRSCVQSDRFMQASGCPRPFEQLQFIRGTAQLYMDLMDPPEKMREFLKRMHDFYCRLMEKWAKTEVDALYFMDDWGSQQNLLISPALWETYFAPMYRDYIQIAHAHGKKIFMHSDGNTLSILPRLIEYGLDAINTQLFCIGVEKLAPFRGKLTFWGEIDRQHLLPYGSERDIEQAVDQVYQTLWQNGGCIAQCEFGPGAKPANVRRVFSRWAELRPERA
jgi:uroporphyrinogen decarboxylase